MIEVTWLTWVVGLAGLALMGLLGGLQFVAVLRPRAEWTVANVYGGSPDATDPTAYFALNQGVAWADTLLWGPLQIAASIGMLAGQRWGFLLALAVSLTYIYTAIIYFVWDRDLAFRQNTFYYWVVVWGIWPTFGAVQGVYTLTQLL